MRRVKIFPVDERALIDILSCWKGGKFITLPNSPVIPDGCRFVSAHHSWECRALMVMLEHPSFPEVPDGAEPPRGEFIEYEALERIPVADHFMEDGFSVVYYPADPTGVALKRARKICKNIGGWSWPRYRQLSPPVAFNSEFPPPKPTSLERWLTVANTEKYTAENPQPLARQYLIKKASQIFKEPMVMGKLGGCE